MKKFIAIITLATIAFAPAALLAEKECPNKDAAKKECPAGKKKGCCDEKKECPAEKGKKK